MFKLNNFLELLPDVRWTSVIDATRAPNVSASEERTRIREGQQLIARTFGVANWLEGIPKIIDDPQEFMAELKKHPHLWQQLSQLILQENLPSNEELLAFKDTLMIPDNKWAFVVSTFKLPSTASRYHIRQLRLEKAKEHKLGDTTSGAFRHILPIIETSIRANKPKDTQINIKFAFDACRMARNSEQVIGSITRVEGEANYKSPFNADQFVMWLGHETYEEYEQELEHLIPEINKLITNNKLVVDAMEYTIEPYLVVDMKTLCVLLGLYEVYRSNTNFKCCWCEVTDDDMANFEKVSWKFRDITRMKELAKLKKKPGDNTGIKVS